MSYTSGTFRSYVTIDDNEISVEVSYDFQPGDPGQLSGPPESCYPPEPGDIEITEISNLTNDVDLEFEKLSESDQYRLLELAYQSGEDKINEIEWEELEPEPYDPDDYPH